MGQIEQLFARVEHQDDFGNAWDRARRLIHNDPDFKAASPDARLKVLQKIAVTLFLERRRR